jgi:hypothetical protein
METITANKAKELLETIPDELEMLLFAESSLTLWDDWRCRHLDPISSVLHDLGCQNRLLFRRRFVIL